MDKIFTISRNDEPPLLRLKNFRNKGNGETQTDIQYDDILVDKVKKALKVDTVTTEHLSTYVNDLIEKSTNGIDGWKMLIEDANPV
jgi:hypothetical protein